MTTKLTAIALSAAFSFATACGLAVGSLADNPQNDSPDTATKHLSPDLGTSQKTPESSDTLVCDQTPSGQALCWPKELAPRAGQGTTCVETPSSAACSNTPKFKGPELEI